MHVKQNILRFVIRRKNSNEQKRDGLSELRRSGVSGDCGEIIYKECGGINL